MCKLVANFYNIRHRYDIIKMSFLIFIFVEGKSKMYGADMRALKFILKVIVDYPPQIFPTTDAESKDERPLKKKQLND